MSSNVPEYAVGGLAWSVLIDNGLILAGFTYGMQAQMVLWCHRLMIGYVSTVKHSRNQGCIALLIP
jgi:hypothetical protein